VLTLPEPVLLITVGIDVQARYLAALTVGWAPDAEAWVLDWTTIEGDPRDPATLMGYVHELDALRFQHPTAGDVAVNLVGIDSGYLTDTVYRAVRAAPRRSGTWVLATKGVGGREGEPLVLPIRDERDAWGRRGLRPLPLNTDAAKGELMAALQVPQPGRGYWHIPRRVGTDFIAQLTSEEQRMKYDADGVPVGVEWRKRTGDARNEALDDAVICLGLFHLVRPGQWLALLQARHGPEAGLARFRTLYPDHRVTPAPPPLRVARSLYLTQGRTGVRPSDSLDAHRLPSRERG
jgi:phage terminase large subunit GpA-like protein